jgi:hypothetical protein
MVRECTGMRRLPSFIGRRVGTAVCRARTNCTGIYFCSAPEIEIADALLSGPCAVIQKSEEESKGRPSSMLLPQAAFTASLSFLRFAARKLKAKRKKTPTPVLHYAKKHWSLVTRFHRPHSNYYCRPTTANKSGQQVPPNARNCPLSCAAGCSASGTRALSAEWAQWARPYRRSLWSGSSRGRPKSSVTEKREEQRQHTAANRRQKPGQRAPHPCRAAASALTTALHAAARRTQT